MPLSDADSDDEEFLRQLGERPVQKPTPLLVRHERVPSSLGALLGTTSVEIAERKISKLLESQLKLEEAEDLINAQAKEVQRLRSTKIRLQSRIEICEEKNILLEKRLARGEINRNTTKVLHLSKQPISSTKYEDAETQTDTDKETVSYLKEQLVELRDDVADSKKSRERLQQVFATQTDQFRDDCVSLLGYRIEFLAKQREYRLWPVYSVDNRSYLLFRRASNGAMHVIDTPFVQTLRSATLQLLSDSRSIPVFLSRITLDLHASSVQNNHTNTM